MKVLLALVMLVAAVSCQDSLPDPHALLKDEPRLSKFIGCMQGKDTCEPHFKVLRDLLPEAINTSCTKCSNNQKTFIGVVGLVLQKDHPEDYKLIEDYFGKERTYKKAFKEFLHVDD